MTTKFHGNFHTIRRKRRLFVIVSWLILNCESASRWFPWKKALPNIVLCKIWLTPLLKEDQEKELHSGNYWQLRGGNMSLHPPAPAQHQRHNNCKVWYLVWLHCGKLSRFMTDAPHCCTLGLSTTLHNQQWPTCCSTILILCRRKQDLLFRDILAQCPMCGLLHLNLDFIPIILMLYPAIMSANVRFTADGYEMRGQ